MKPKLFTTIANNSSSLCVLLHGCVSVSAGSRLVYRLLMRSPAGGSEELGGQGLVPGFQPSLDQPEEGRGTLSTEPQGNTILVRRASKFVSWSRRERRQLDGEVWGSSPGGAWRQAARVPHPLGCQSCSVSAPD